MSAAEKHTDEFARVWIAWLGMESYQLLPSRTKDVLIAMTRYQDRDRHVTISRDQIAEMTGIGRTDVRRHIRRLEEAGIVKIIESGHRGRPSEYLLIVPSYGGEVAPVTSDSFEGNPAPITTNYYGGSTTPVTTDRNEGNSAPETLSIKGASVPPKNGNTGAARASYGGSPAPPLERDKRKTTKSLSPYHLQVDTGTPLDIDAALPRGARVESAEEGDMLRLSDDARESIIRGLDSLPKDSLVAQRLAERRAGKDKHRQWLDVNAVKEEA